jgi:hypothetical protein
MTETLARPAGPSGAPSERGDRSVPLLVAAGALVLVVVAAVLLFGVDRPPALAALADDPDPAPPAGVAWMGWTGDEACVAVARPDGEVEQLWCDRAGGELVGWPETGMLEIRSWESGDVTRAIDAETGEVLGRTPGPDAGGTDPEGEWRGPEPAVWTQRRDGRLTVRLQTDDTVVWRTEAPERYDVHASARSADGRWIAMIDAAERLLVVPADGSTAPRVWATGVDGWEPPVWEGTSRS